MLTWLGRWLRPVTGDLGRDGEAVAARYLESQGFRITGRRVRTPHGEIDLIATRDGLVVFVEVKTRRSTEHAAPADAVDEAKAERIRRSALFLASRRHELSGRPLRIDVVEVVWPAGREPEIRHREDAIDRGRWS